MSKYMAEKGENYIQEFWWENVLKSDYFEGHDCDENRRTNIMRTLTQLIVFAGLDEDGLTLEIRSSVAGFLPLDSCSQWLASKPCSYSQGQYLHILSQY
jgi:hypothetical protein